MEKITGNEQAMPRTGWRAAQGGDAHNTEPELGLTIRQYYAGLAMQGLLARYKEYPSDSNMDTIAKSSVIAADALIEQLNRKQ